MSFVSTENQESTAYERQPVLFEEFFTLGLADSASPFLTPSSRGWGKNLPLKGAILSAFLLVIAFVLSFWENTVPLSFIALLGVYFFAGMPSLIDTIEDLLNTEINIDMLMTLAAFSSFFIGSGMEGGLLLVLFSLSGAMEEAVEGKAKSAINNLHRLSPTTALVIEDEGRLIERNILDVPIGTKILVRAGQMVPLDGIILEGTSSINMVHLTGENLPITKKPGDEVPSGGRNLEGALTLEVVRTSNDSTLSRIIQLVTEAQEARPELQRWFDKLSRSYAITIIIAAGILSVTLPWLLNIPFLGMEGGVYRALAFLIAASPCALIIAIPIAYLSAISACARKGILLKGGITLDALASCKIMAFDKTGTLTTGSLSCSGIKNLSHSTISDDEALQIAYAMERNAVHPVAQAVISLAENRQLPPAALESFRSVAGYGLEATTLVQGALTPVAIGHPDFIAEKIPKEAAAKLMEKTVSMRSSGHLVAALAVGEQAFLFQFEDTPRPHIKKVLKALHDKRKMRLLMLTGDHHDSAKRVAEEMGIDEFHADLKPEDKLSYVTKLSAEKGLAMVGDGINDAPALARATVGICMGKIGSTAAIDAADVVLLQDNLEHMDWLLEKAHLTQTIVRQNLSLAVCAIIIASLPALAGLVPLWLAVVLHEGGTVLVGLNGLRLLRK